MRRRPRPAERRRGRHVLYPERPLAYCASHNGEREERGWAQVSDPASTESHRLPVRVLVAASIGNAIEWFDWTVYATFAVYFSSHFFAKTSPPSR